MILHVIVNLNLHKREKFGLYKLVDLIDWWRQGYVVTLGVVYCHHKD